MKRFVVLVLLMSIFATAQQEAIIYQDNTHLRKGHGSYYPLLGILVKDAIVTILKETAGWAKIRVSGQEGWISQNALSKKDRATSSVKTSDFKNARPAFLSRASASGAVKGFAQTYLKKHNGSMAFLDQYDAAFFQPREYENFRQETYRNRNMKKIRERYRRIKIENKEPEINSYLEKLGFAVAGQIASGGLETDIQKLRYINMVGNLIVESTPLYYYPFKFYILS
ncbi:MAG: SH3 domain-containing protein, partial [Candidatus Marinimicrobia bacterium]|nr:SH3 domain-containing protein [Candidatus Neomarinimicrobiota bacterium]